MNLPDTQDAELTLWNKVLENNGGTVDPNAHLRAVLAALLALLTA